MSVNLHDKNRLGMVLSALPPRAKQPDFSQQKQTMPFDPLPNPHPNLDLGKVRHHQMLTICMIFLVAGFKQCPKHLAASYIEVWCLFELFPRGRCQRFKLCFGAVAIETFGFMNQAHAPLAVVIHCPAGPLHTRSLRAPDWLCRV